MFRILLLSFTCCLLVLIISDLEAQAVTSSFDNNLDSMDVSCPNALQREMNRDEVLDRMGWHLFPSGKNERFREFLIKALWEIPIIRDFLRSLAEKIYYIDRQISKYSYDLYEYDHNRTNSYREKLIESILSFIESISTATIDIGTPMTGNSSVSEDDIKKLTSQIKPLEELINQLDTVSPVESLVYAYIIDESAKYIDKIIHIENTRGLIGEFDLKRYISKNKDEIFYGYPGHLDISSALQSEEQKRYLFQTYQLLQENSSQSTSKIAPSQNNHLAKTEQYMRKQGYGKKYIEGFDHATAMIDLAESLRMRSIDPVNTHIPEFAELIDTHLDFIREDVNTSDKLSDSDKIKKIELLNLLKIKAQSYKDSKRVTYLYWLNFNLQLSIIATPHFDLPKFDNDSFYSYLFEKAHQNSTDHVTDMDYNSFKEWIVNADGSHLLKIASLVSMTRVLNEPQHYAYDDDNILMNIINNLGLNLTLEEMKALPLKYEYKTLLIEELVHQMNFESELNNTDLSINAFYASYELRYFIYLFNQFPVRIMLPTIHDLGIMSINKTYGNGVHLIGLEKDVIRADGEWMSPFRFFIHDISHASSRHIDEPQAFNQFQNNLESFSLSTLVRELIEKLYFELAHEAGVKVLNARSYNNGHRRQVIETMISNKNEVFLKLAQKLGDLTESEKLEFQRTLLMLNYLALPEEYIIFDNEEELLKNKNIEFTEENINDPAIFAKLILNL